jgi:hypothetical protein
MTPPSQARRWLGLDIGGANLKAADGRGAAVTEAFALWREPQSLAARIGTLISEIDVPFDAVALTMTGELADCFATKAEGVRAIVEATVSACGDGTVRVATVDDRWLKPVDAIAEPSRVAAANWRLFARWGGGILAAHGVRGAVLVADCGSTTVDLLPVAIEPDGGVRVATHGTTDTERLLAGELVYTGIRRTPVAALVGSLPVRGAACPVAAELFATSADAWLLVGELAASDRDDTADGRPLRPPFARARLARMVCADPAEIDDGDALLMAEAIVASQVALVAGAVRRCAAAPTSVLVAGEGATLLRRALVAASSACPVIELGRLIGPDVAACAPAHAAAVLAGSEGAIVDE